MKRLVSIFLAICLLFTGCGWLDGEYHSVTPHEQHSSGNDSQVEVVENYLQLRTALENMVTSGTEKNVISVVGFQQERLIDSLDMAVRYIKKSHPIGAYAVDEVTYEVGTIGSMAAVAVEITYLHEKNEIRKIRRAEDMDQVRELIAEALTQYDTSLVVYIDNYMVMDTHQAVEDFAAANPAVVMETPEVVSQIYPESGSQRVLELKFNYQSSRDTLRSMRELVQRIFVSASLYISQDAQDSRKLSQLYAFLMERFDNYQVKTSITPAYSVLNHGVGDSAAFAEVYAEMCRRAGMECYVVVGTRDGAPWCWNIVQDDGYYYHVDLLACQSRGKFRCTTDAQMGDYVWDYSAYPACTGRPVVEQPQEPAEGTTPAGTVPEPGK